MNQFIKKMIGAVGVLLVLLTLSQLAKAQITTEKLTKMAEVQIALKELISDVNGEINIDVAALSTTDPAFGCGGNVSTWPSSTTPTMENPWSYLTLTSLAPNSQALMDMNGDGLIDFLSINPGGSDRRVCLYLNNGTNFDLTYRCRRYNSVSETLYYGDCADLSS